MARTVSPTYLPVFRRDVQQTVLWSENRFGAAAASRYSLLIQQALNDLLERPTRPGAQARSDLAPHAFVYHLALSRDRVTGERVKSPRHFILYRYAEDKVEFARLLHDSRDLSRHRPATFPAE